MIKRSKYLFLLLLSMFFMACGNKTDKAQQLYNFHPQWSYNAVIYELNTRQFTPEGTFQSAQKHLSRLKDLGVDIIWVMPISPIGLKERKGKLGSYYSIKDYKAINPEFGTFADFKEFVAEAHKKGIKIIIDWVSNHTSRDAVWLKNKDWYVLDSTGNPVTPFDWTDVAKLNYNNEDMRNAMLDAMIYWIKEADIDGFRCDVAGEVPTDFWQWAISEIKKVKSDIFMLAEAEKPELHNNAFDMTYAWELHSIMNKTAQGKSNADSLRAYLSRENKKYKKDDFRMIFTSNHDENSWNGTEFERMGEAVKTFAAMSYVLPGMPLIYNGQECGFNRRLYFFKKDSIDLRENEFTDFYKKLNCMRHKNSALQSGEKGAELIELEKDNKNVFSFVRKNDNDAVIAIFNLSAQPETVDVKTKGLQGEYVNVMNNEIQKIGDSVRISLDKWEYKIFENRK